LVVSVPMRTAYRNGVSESPAGRRYRAWLAELLASRPGVTYVDLSGVARDDEFIDGVHVGPRGAATFSEGLAAALSRLPSSPASSP
jgi:hypothetical protein